MNHFKEIWQQLQSNFDSLIPEELIDKTKQFCEKNGLVEGDLITYGLIDNFLKKTGNANWCFEIDGIMRKCGFKKICTMSDEDEAMFKKSHEYIRVIMDEKSSILSYGFMSSRIYRLDNI